MLHIMYRIPLIRERICRYRFLILTKRKHLKVASKKNVLHSKYSSEHFGKYTSYKRRINFLLGLVEDNFQVDNNSSVLSIGPRFESELFGLRGLGFKWKQIEAIDTYSYSPHITAGNMHNLPFDNSKFDIIVAGWVIAYSKDPLGALCEFHRVLKPNGVLIFTWELPIGCELRSFKDISLYRQKVIGDGTKLLKSFDIFSLKVGTFKIQSLICSSIGINPTPTSVAAIFRKGTL